LGDSIRYRPLQAAAQCASRTDRRQRQRHLRDQFHWRRAGGCDTLNGGSGNDVITGGLHRDFLTGGSCSQRFDFNSVSEIGKGSTRDIIKDFTHGADDIDLAIIDANGSAAGNARFTFLAAKGAAFTGDSGELRWFQQNLSGTASDKTIIEGDINGDRRADFQIQLTGLKALRAADFFL
jgi:serralysin